MSASNDNLTKSDQVSMADQGNGASKFEAAAAKLRSALTGEKETSGSQDWHDIEEHSSISNFESEAARVRSSHTGSNHDTTKTGALFGESGTLLNYKTNSPINVEAGSQATTSQPPNSQAPASQSPVLRTTGTKSARFDATEASGHKNSQKAVGPVTSPEACPVCVQKHNTEHHNTHTNHLQDQAATAALYVTKSHSGSNKSHRSKETFLDSDNKLSSAGAAASLKYASAQDLPSYPSVGLNPSAAGTAATLGYNSKSPDGWWKPDGTSAAASKAAMIAKDYKMQPLWQPEQSSNGAKAALLAHKDGGKVDIWLPSASKDGHSAATLAMKNGKNNALSPQIDYGYTDLGRSKSLKAATGAIKENNRRLADTTPVVKPETYPDEHKAVANALSAASRANKNELARTNERGSVPYVQMPREMFTSNPPVSLETDEKAHQESLHASAVAMAKKMYIIQQDQIAARAKSQGLSGATAAHERSRELDSDDDEIEPMRFNNLQEAAQKLAQERLAKLHDEHAQNREYRGYYGQDNKVGSRLSLRGSRGRTNNDEDLDDKAQAQKIRQQASLFSSNLSQVDGKKRQADREALMAAAQRNVSARLSTMDENVFRDTGKISASMLDEWEIKAHAAAQKSSESRMENYGKVNIGGGKFINQSAIDLVARKRIQPLLDDITEKAEQQRVRDAEMKLEMESKKREEDNKKIREKEVKNINKKLKAQQKDEERLRKQEVKKEKDEAKRGEREAKEKERLYNRETAALTTNTTTASEPAEEVNSQASSELAESPNEEAHRSTDRHPAGYTAPTDFRASTESENHVIETANVETKTQSGMPAAVPTSPSNGEASKKSSWYKRFSSKSENSKSKAKTVSTVGNNSTAKDAKSRAIGGIGGSVLSEAPTNVSNITATRDSSRDNAASATPHHAAGSGVAAVGGTTALVIAHSHEEDVENEEEEDVDRGRRTERAISPVSSISEASVLSEDLVDDDSEQEYEEARDNFDEALAPPPTFPAEKSTSPSRASKFTEVV